jgi:glycosyltransferase involved in cell wall biosynthesis
MKMLYITPKINNEGGVARVLSIKTNYLVEHFDYEIHIVTQNEGNVTTFYNYNPIIQLHDITLNGNPFSFLWQYKIQIEQTIKKINPDIVVLCDFGWKAFFFPFIIKTVKPVIFEAHASKFNEPIEYKKHWFKQITHRFKYFFRNYSIKKFDAFVVLSNEALSEWNAKKGTVIPNPIWLNNTVSAALEAKKVIVATRYSYEKGLDRLLQIWALVLVKHPDWILEIYGKTKDGLALESLAQKLNIAHAVYFFPPEKNIEDKYLQSSIYAMTSRSEAFPMVLLEAMSCGLPVIAFDCPVGPRTIIKDNENGFLIDDGNLEAYANQLISLMDSQELRLKIGVKARNIRAKYSLEMIMKQWNEFFLQYKNDAKLL